MTGFKRHVDAALVDVVNGGLGSAGITIGLDDLRGVFQTVILWYIILTHMRHVTVSRVLKGGVRVAGWVSGSWPTSTHLAFQKSSTQTNDLLFKQAAVEDERLEELSSWLPFPQLPKPGAF